MNKQSWQEEYSFKDHFFTAQDGNRIHYIDEGAGEPVVMVHGNPTWSFMFRGVISHLSSSSHRAIAIDHLGCGLSDKPQDGVYTLENHISNLEYLIDNILKLEKLDLILHDWGGGIGMGYAVRHPEKIRRIVLMNTAAYCAPRCPWRIALCRIPVLGALLVRGCNLFAGAAVHMATAKGLSKTAKEGLLHPYGNWHDRIAIHRFVRDIPMSRKHPTRPILEDIENKLSSLSGKPVLLCWGMRDFCFNKYYFDRWRKIYPNASILPCPDAGHYLLEDAPDKVIPAIREFLD